MEELGWDFESAFFHLSKRFEGSRGASAPPTAHVTSPFREIEAVEHVDLPVDRTQSELGRILRERRTHREFESGELMLDQVSTILRDVWGAQRYGHDRSGAPVLAKTSPSGGSLHPLEVYPLLARVHGVEAGLYHYSVRRHALELMERLDPQAVRDLADELTAGQTWFADAQAFFLVTARFERFYAKYRKDPGAYQSLLLEAGHFSQTFYLVATELGLGPFVTTVINHADIDRRLGLDPYREGALMILGCGLPAAPQQEVHPRPFVPRETELDA